MFCTSLAKVSAASATVGNRDCRVSLAKLSNGEECASKKVCRITAEHSASAITEKNQPQRNAERSEIDFQQPEYTLTNTQNTKHT